MTMLRRLGGTVYKAKNIYTFSPSYIYLYITRLEYSRAHREDNNYKLAGRDCVLPLRFSIELKSRLSISGQDWAKPAFRAQRNRLLETELYKCKTIVCPIKLARLYV